MVFCSFPISDDEIEAIYRGILPRQKHVVSPSLGQKFGIPL